MRLDAPDNLANGGMTCPTCQAAQEWSDVCRRCKCELTLLRQAVEAAQRSRRRCLRSLRAGRTDEALRQARHLYALRPDRTAARLLAVCHFIEGDWAAAAALLRSA